MRSTVFTGLLVLSVANGIVSRVDRTIQDQGLGLALMNTFQISVIVWAAFAACLALLRRMPAGPMRRLDMAVAAVALAMIALPASPLSWIALTGLSIHLITDARRRRPGPGGRPGGPPGPEERAGWIMLAMTGSMFWGNLLLSIASGVILAADAVLVSALFGASRVGNTLGFADGSGFVWIAPSCSSMANMSLAILCWVVVTQWRGVPWAPRNVAWCGLACLSVACINLTRIGMITLRPEEFDLLHGPVGAAAASWASVIAAVAISLLGTRHARLARD